MTARRHQGTRAPTTAPLSRCCHLSFLLPYTLQTLPPLLLRLSNLRRGLLFPPISQVTHSNSNFIFATAEWRGSALLQDQGSLAVLAPSTTPVHHLKIQAQEKLHFPKRAAIQDIPHEFHPTCQHKHLGFEHTAIAMAWFQLETGHLETPKERFGSQKALSRDRQQKSSCLSDYWAVHTRQASLFP